MGDLPSFTVRRAPPGALAAPTHNMAVKLTADTAVTVTPPSGATIVNFVPKTRDAVFYVRWDGSAAAEPTGTISNGSASEPNPVSRNIAGVTTFSIVSPDDDTIVIMQFFTDESEIGEEDW